MEDRAGEIGNLPPQQPTPATPTIEQQLAAKYGIDPDKIYDMGRPIKYIGEDEAVYVTVRNYYKGGDPKDIVDLANVLEVGNDYEPVLEVLITRAECVALGMLLLRTGLDTQHWPADDPGLP